MNSKLVLIAALAAVSLNAAAVAQTPDAAAAPAKYPTPAAAAPVPAPVAIPAKIAFIELSEVAQATNEGQAAIAALEKKYQPTKQKLEQEKNDIDSLTKQLESAPASMSQDEKASRAHTIDTKQKQLQLEGDDFNTTANAEAQSAIAKVIGKLGPVVVKYVQQNGYTVLLDNTGQPQQGGLNLLWGGTDISQAVVDAYNATSPATAPVPSAPAAARPRTTPKPAAPKQ
jgi:outer membrane protein